MLKANELRIGNYVYFKDTLLKFEFDSGWNFDYIKPIPLTQEWLSKFRFTIKDTQYAYLNLPNKGAYIYVNHNGTGIALENDEFELSYPIELKYVHQLQNLYFSLTGIELIFISHNVE